jgi:hypothetical protein
MLYRIIAYLLSIYTLYLYAHDIMLIYNQELPVINLFEKFDLLMIHVGGLVSGILLIRNNNKFDKYWGAGMIILNVLIVPYLYMDAIV